MSIDLVTTMNLRLYDQYGAAMIKSIDQYAERSIRIFVSFEGELPDDLQKYSERVLFVPYEFEPHQNFLSIFSPIPEASGIKSLAVAGAKEGSVLTFYDYRFDAIRFSHKVFHIAALHVLDRLGGIRLNDKLIWLDGDTRAIRVFCERDLNPFLPQQNELMSYLGRRTYGYSECGFLGFNTLHKNFDEFISRMANVYISGELFIFEQWHDSWVWDRVREEFEKEGVLFRNISGDTYDTEHPFINSGLGLFLDHLKGDARKAQGRSFDSDRVLLAAQN